MGFTIEGFNRAKSRMAAEFNKAIADAETLRKDAERKSSDDRAKAPAGAPEKSGVSADASPADVDRPGIQVEKAK